MDSKTQQGITAEYQFIVDACKHGFLPSIPVKDHRGYDLIIHGEKKLYKIQVKSTRKAVSSISDINRKTHYKITLARRASSEYKKEHLDFFAIYIFDMNQWFIIPFNVVTTKTIRIYPQEKSHKFSKFQEAWHLIE